MVLKVGINGFGRIGRVIFRTCLQNDDLEVAAINDPAIDIDYICYLLKFDSTHGKLKSDITFLKNEITIKGNIVKVFREKLPSNIPWETASVQYVVEASGMFTSYEKASGHLSSQSVIRVLVTAPSADVPMLIIGVNEDSIKKGYTDHRVVSCASSTLYCLAPIIKILEDNYQIIEGFITSIHAMTPSLKPLDGLCLRGKHWRDHRSIHQNIIPAATGACKALGKIIPGVKNKLTGLAFRVPIVNVSVLDITIRLNKNTSIQDIVRCINIESKSGMKNVIKTSYDYAVSSDFLGEEKSCILDVNSCLQLTPNFFKLICWYENEYSYACRVVDSIKFLDKIFQLDLESKMTYTKPIAAEGINNRLPNSFYNRDSTRIFNLFQNTGFKAKLRHRVCPKSSLSLRSSSLNHIVRDIKQKNDIYLLTKDDEEKKSIEQDPSDFKSSITCGITKEKHSDYNKTQKHLEEVIKDFHKMVDMTQSLLMKTKTNTQVVSNSIKTNMKENVNINDFGKAYSNNKTPSDNYYQIESYNDNLFDSYKNVKAVDKTVNNKSDNNVSNDDNSDILLLYGKTLNKNDNLEKQKKINLEKLKNHLKTKADFDNPKECVKDINNDIEHTRNKTIDTKLVNNIYTKINKPITMRESEFHNCYQHDDKKTIIVENNNNQNVINNESSSTETLTRAGEIRNKIIEGLMKKLSMESSLETNYTTSTVNTKTTGSGKYNQFNDIYDKIDSVSGTDSDNSFQMNEKQSEVIEITDLTNSIEDLVRLDKICRIIEISDELSDKLFSALDNKNEDYKKKKWSFKELCENIKLDDFCNKVFVNTASE